MKITVKKIIALSLIGVMLLPGTGSSVFAENEEGFYKETLENTEIFAEEDRGKEEIPGSQEEEPDKDGFEETHLPKENEGTPEEERLLPEENEGTPEEEMHLPKEDIGTPEEETHLPKEDIETPEEEGTLSEEEKVLSEEEELEVNAEETYAIYQTHIEDIGWQGFRSKGEISGVPNEGKRIEAIEIKTNRPGLEIEYQTHIQDIGWETSMKKNGEPSGTTGQSKKIEAIRIFLTGEEKEKYDVYYQVKAQDFGWLDFGKNGEDAGTAGRNLRLEAIKIMIQKKGTAAPGATATPFISKEFGKNLRISYSTHIQDIGWQAPVSNGEISGTVGKAKQLEAIKINVPNTKGLGIEYQSHIENIGWQEWKTNQELSGTEGQALQLEALSVRLTGSNARFYDLYYKVHVENIGWMDYAKNGEPAGTEGRNLQLESVKILILLKGENPPKLRHFGDDDFKCEDGCGGDIKEALKYKMDEVVDILGRPLVVTSGYRCKRQNAIDGGVWDSLHMSGDAVDAYTPGMSREMVNRLAESGLKADLGVIRYYTDQFVHFQTYPRNQSMRVMVDGVD